MHATLIGGAIALAYVLAMGVISVVFQDKLPEKFFMWSTAAGLGVCLGLLALTNAN